MNNMEESKYKSLSAWKKAKPTAYAAAKKMSVIKDVCEKYGWEFKITKQNFWTKERCLEDALKYKKRSDWKKKSGGSFNSAMINKWLDECCSHMNEKKREFSGYWTKERCLEDALKYNVKTEWQNKSSGAYGSARKSKWLDKCCAHMKQSKPHGYWTKERCKIDALKYNTKKDWGNNSGGAYSTAKKNKWFNECCAHMLKLVKPHGYWTLEHCKEDALKYKTRNDWNKLSHSAYSTARKNKWLEECCKHMTEIMKPRRYWTKKKCLEDALKYNLRTEWIKNSGGAYNVAKNNNWIEDCCSHMKVKKSRTLDECKLDALKYKGRREWQDKSNAIYNNACRNKWLDECCRHMVEIRKPSGYWTLEKCKEEALKHNSKEEWKFSSPGSHTKARKSGWTDKCCKHMK